MKVLLNDKGFIESYAIVGDLVGAIEVDFDENILDAFESDYQSYKLIEGKIEFDQSRKKEIIEQQELTDLRSRREEECFPIVNRGELWYKHLTNNQITELDTWYQAWLDVTETKIIPDKPVWLE